MSQNRDGGWSFAADPTGRAYNACPDTLAGFRKEPRLSDKAYKLP